MKQKLFLTILFLSSMRCVPETDITLTQLEQFANSMPETINDADMDWRNPQFIKFFERSRPTWIGRMLQFLKLQRTFPWFDQSFNEVLEKTRIAHAQQIRSLDGIRGISQNTLHGQLFVWGPLHGAWHSLLRTLRFLQQEGIINESLKIEKADTYFIFMGNLTDRSPYGLETFYTLCLLCAENPDHVFILGSHSEQKNNWTYQTLGQQLNAFHLQFLIPSFTQTFELLPLFFLCTDAQKKYACMITSWYALQEKNILANMRTKYQALLFDEGQTHTQGSKLTGLDLKEPNDFATSWLLTSSPTQVFKKYYHFDEDSFVEINLPPSFENASIRVIQKKSAENKQAFSKGEWQNLFTGEIITDNAKKMQSSFSIGSTLGLSQGVITMSQNIKIGMSQRIIQQNKQGGVQNIFLKLAIIDDAYRAGKALKNIEQFIKLRINTILLPTGSPTLAQYLSKVQDGTLSVFFPVTGGPQFRDEKNSHIIHWRASYADEVRALLHYVAEKQSAKKFVFFYQDDAFGKGPLEAAHAFLKEKGITEWVDVPYTRTTLDFKEAAQAIKKADPQAIGFFSIAPATQELIRQLGNEFFIGRTSFGVSFLAEVAFRTFLTQEGITMFFAQVVPNPKKSSLPIVQEYRNLMDSLGYFYDIFSLEGYIATSIFIEALKKINPPFSGATVMNEMEKFKDVSFKGLTLTFNPKTRSLAQKVWLEVDPQTDWIETAIE